MMEIFLPRGDSDANGRYYLCLYAKDKHTLSRKLSCKRPRRLRHLKRNRYIYETKHFSHHENYCIHSPLEIGRFRATT